MSINPNSVRGIVTLMAFYLHVGPYSRHVMKQIDRQIEDLEQGNFAAPKLLPAVQPEAGRSERIRLALDLERRQRRKIGYESARAVLRIFVRHLARD